MDYMRAPKSLATIPRRFPKNTNSPAKEFTFGVSITRVLLVCGGTQIPPTIIPGAPVFMIATPMSRSIHYNAVHPYVLSFPVYIAAADSISFRIQIPAPPIHQRQIAPI